MKLNYEVTARAVMIAVLVVGWWTLDDYGVTTDETWRMLSADNFWRAIAEGRVQSYVTGTRANYGIAFDLLGRALWLLDERLFGETEMFRVRHALCLVTGVAGLFATHRLARRFGPEPLPLLAVILLAAAPRVYGSAFANPKDVPFMAAVVIAVAACVRAIQEPSRRATFLLAIATGVCTAVRPLGSVFFAVGALCIVAPIAQGGFRGRAVAWRRALGQVLLFAVAAYAVALLLWPVLWVRTPDHLVTAPLALTQHIRGSRSLFMGEQYPFRDAPPLYAVVWVAITVSIPILAFGIFGALERVVNIRRRVVESLPWLLLLGWVVGPLVVPALRRTTLYDTSRQLLFVVPPLCILAAHGIVVLARSRHKALRAATWVLVAVGLLEAGVRMVTLHPYQSLYFSPVVGGLSGARGRFDVAHYSETYAEGFRWLRDHGTPPVVVQVTGNGTYTAEYLGWRSDLRVNGPEFDYTLSEVRQGWENLLPGNVVHTIEREGVPLLVIKEVDSIDRASSAALSKERDGPGRVLRSDQGQFDIEAGWLTFDLHSPRDQQVVLYLCFYWGLRAFLDDELVYEVTEVPFHYRGSEDFPSIVPLRVDLHRGSNRLVFDLDRTRHEWKFGLYYPASYGLTTNSE